MTCIFGAASGAFVLICAQFERMPHLARATISTDPLCDDFAAMQATHADLIPQDRGITAHNARKGSDRRFGLSDLVRIIHPDIGIQYLHLHGASVGVRYEKGIRTSLDDLRLDLDEVSEYFSSDPKAERLEELRKLLLDRIES